MTSLRFVSLFVGLIISFTSSLSAQSEFRYSYIPKKVYKNQLFPVTIVGSENNVKLTFDRSSTIQPISPKPLLVKNGKDTFYTFYFKADKKNVRIPRLFIITASRKISLDGHIIPINIFKAKQDFSGVFATKMTIKSQQVSNYDTKNHIVTLIIEAYEANVEDMSLKKTIEDGVENIQRDNAKVSAEFYAVLPREQKTLDFSYFNTLNKQYKSFTIPIEVVNASVTTQSDLNPKVDAFERLKRYALITFSVFFMIMFLWRRDFFYLILGVISIITLLTFYIPHKKICVKQGSPLYILPTKTSTVGAKINMELETMLLGTRGAYSKVEYKQGIIGWIKNEDICKN